MNSSAPSDSTPSIHAVDNDSILQLDQLKPGQVVDITGDSGEFSFYVIEQEASGPIGFLYNDELDMKVVQLVGMLPFPGMGPSKSGVATLQTGVLIEEEYGNILAIETQNMGAHFKTFTFCCSSFEVSNK